MAAARIQGRNRNLVPTDQKLVDFLAQVRRHSGSILNRFGIKNRHELRAAYACDRYSQITGKQAPIIADYRLTSIKDDQKARKVIALELGHNRIDVLSSYLGSPAPRRVSRATVRQLPNEPLEDFNNQDNEP